MEFQVTRELVRKILERATSYKWTLQGFGMLRLYLGGCARLHVWHKDLAVPNVSDIHTHPWSLRSLVVCGRLHNVRFTEMDAPAEYLTHYAQELVTGEGGGLISKPRLVRLTPATLSEYYAAGNVYSQGPSEIHVSYPEDGTVTVMERNEMDRAPAAWTYWPRTRGADGWVSAEPRVATDVEVAKGVSLALTRIQAERHGVVLDAPQKRA